MEVVAAYVTGMILLCLILGLLPPLPADLMHLISRLMQYLALAFTIALSVDALMMLVLLPLEAILGSGLKREKGRLLVSRYS